MAENRVAPASHQAHDQETNLATTESPCQVIDQVKDQVPLHITTEGYTSLGDMLDRALKRHAEKTACVSFGVGLTFADLDASAERFAAWLQTLNLPHGSRIAVMTPNTPVFLSVMLGTIRAGHVLVAINPLFTVRELQQQLQDSQSEVIVCLENFAHVLQQVKDCPFLHHRVVVSLGDMLGPLKGRLVNMVVRHVKKMVPAWSMDDVHHWSDVMRVGSQSAFWPVEISMDDLAVLQYTGGTTGTPKGAMLTHRNIVANVIQVEAVAWPALKDLMHQQLTMMTALPLYHIFAMTVCGFYCLHAGMKNVLVVNPRDFADLSKSWKKHPVNIFPAVNTLFNALADNKVFRQLDFSALRLTFGGGMAVQRAVADKWKALTGCPIIEGYGLSEASPVVAANPTTSKDYSGSVGLPLPSTEIRIVSEHHDVVEKGEVGEIAIRGPQLMRGYWNAPEETRRVMTEDGFFLTGDMGYMDDRGYVTIVDRKKDMAIVSGFNVYPSEIEAVVAQHPAVHECAAIGVPDTHSGECIKLFVVKKNTDLAEAELIEWCRGQLTGYKVPRQVEFRDNLPKTNVGKILRRGLRQ